MKNKKILVTGGGGFIPSHLVKRLLREGAKVTVLTKYNSVFDNIRLSRVWDDIEVIEADLRNLDSVKHAVRFKPDVVYHMAAYNHVGDSFVHVSEAIGCNCMGTVNLLESYREFEKFVYTSTSEVYGYQEAVPFTETMTPRPISPYAVGKYSGEIYARMMHHVYNLPVAVVRPFNTFGPYQSPRAVIAEMIIKCLEGTQILATEGRQTREFNYVDNIIDGLVAVATSDKSVGAVINISSGNEITIKDLILKIHEYTGSTSELKIGALPYRPTEIWRMYGDNTLAGELLGWTATMSFDEGLKKTIAWYRKFLGVFKDRRSGLFSLDD